MTKVGKQTQLAQRVAGLCWEHWNSSCDKHDKLLLLKGVKNAEEQ
jgi:hypothetical protein